MFTSSEEFMVEHHSKNKGRRQRSQGDREIEGGGACTLYQFSLKN